MSSDSTGVIVCFSGMLEGLCNNLYDVLRPLIIHVNHLETLAELCSILKVRNIETLIDSFLVMVTCILHPASGVSGCQV